MYISIDRISSKKQIMFRQTMNQPVGISTNKFENEFYSLSQLISTKNISILSHKLKNSDMYVDSEYSDVHYRDSDILLFSSLVNSCCVSPIMDLEVSLSLIFMLRRVRACKGCTLYFLSSREHVQHTKDLREAVTCSQ